VGRAIVRASSPEEFTILKTRAKNADQLDVAVLAAPMVPEQAAVVSRALCLATLAVRGFLESATLLSATAEDREDYDGLTLRLNKWLNEQDFTAGFTYLELEALSATPGAWSTVEHESHANRIEALGVLLWALSVNETFAGYDQPFPMPNLEILVGWKEAAILTPSIFNAAEFPVNGGAALHQMSRLRPPPIISGHRSSADCWKWRTDLAALERSGAQLPPGQNFSVMVGIAAQEAHAAGAILRPIQNDFPFQNKAFGRVSDAEQLQCAQRVQARKLALDWLSGYATAWDAIPCVAAAA
jgi:hypothetical protein